MWRSMNDITHPHYPHEAFHMLLLVPTLAVLLNCIVQRSLKADNAISRIYSIHAGVIARDRNVLEVYCSQYISQCGRSAEYSSSSLQIEWQAHLIEFVLYTTIQALPRQSVTRSVCTSDGVCAVEVGNCI